MMTKNRMHILLFIHISSSSKLYYGSIAYVFIYKHKKKNILISKLILSVSRMVFNVIIISFILISRIN